MKLLKKCLQNDGQLFNIFEIKWVVLSPLKPSDYSARPFGPAARSKTVHQLSSFSYSTEPVVSPVTQQSKPV